HQRVAPDQASQDRGHTLHYTHEPAGKFKGWRGPWRSLAVPGRLAHGRNAVQQAGETLMRWRGLIAVLCVALVAAVAWMAGARDEKKPDGWAEVSPGVLRSPGMPAGHALLDGDAALLLDAPVPPDGLKAHGVKKVEGVLLTHHHRDVVAAVGRFLADKVPVRAPKASAEWLTPENVRKYWKESLPL